METTSISIYQNAAGAVAQVLDGWADVEIGGTFTGRKFESNDAAAAALTAEGFTFQRVDTIREI